MKILVTGAKGFVGKNLCAQLNNIKTGKAKWYGIGPAAAETSAETVATRGLVSGRGPAIAGRDERSEVSAMSQTAAGLTVDEVYEYDIDSTPEQLDQWCKDCDFVFNLAGVNRPKDQSEFMTGNFGFASTLLDTLKKHGNTCPVMLSSSQQASLTGRFGNSEYGRSKKAGEDLFLKYSEDTGAKVLVYRFPNLFGKWCRPNYNSAVATFCNNIANDLPIQVNDPSVEMELLYIDDLVDEMIEALKGNEHRCEFDGLEVIPVAAEEAENVPSETVATSVIEAIPTLAETAAEAAETVATRGLVSGRGPATAGKDERSEVSASQTAAKQGRYCYCPITHKITLGEIVDLIYSFAEQPKTLMIPEIPEGSFAKKLYTTYLSYLPKEKVAFPLKMNVDNRGSFTELVHTLNGGQVSINISKPGITKGQHWHNTKWEFFIVVAGHGLIQERKIGSDEVIEFEVSGQNIQAIHMLPGYTHNIINLSDTEDLVTVMWCNEIFNPNHPDTYGEPVIKQ